MGVFLDSGQTENGRKTNYQRKRPGLSRLRGDDPSAFVTRIRRNFLQEGAVAGFQLTSIRVWHASHNALSFRSIHSTAWEGAIAH